MIQKLKAYGFSGKSVNFVCSFVGSRKNQVNLQKLKGELKEQTRGCPQGWSFGPLVWNLFQNDLSSYTESENLFMYADDHQMYTIGDSINNGAQMQGLKEETEKVMWWYSQSQRISNHLHQLKVINQGDNLRQCRVFCRTVSTFCVICRLNVTCQFKAQK